MGKSVIVSNSNFTTDVLQQSYEKLVLVDFYATWCGPCQMLKPLLEKLVQEYDFVLATVDIDQHPDLAHTYQVQGVPDVRIVSQGEVQEGFVGVLPEPKLRALLSKFKLKSALEVGLEAIQVAKTAGDLPEVERLFTALLQKYPGDRPLRLQAANFLMSQNQLEEADTVLAPIQEYEREFFSQAKAIRGLIQFKLVSTQLVTENELDEQYLQAICLTLEGNYEMALQGFLSIVSCDRSYRDDGARKAMLTIFDLLGDSHPLAKNYRKQLMLTLY